MYSNDGLNLSKDELIEYLLELKYHSNYLFNITWPKIAKHLIYCRNEFECQILATKYYKGI